MSGARKPARARPALRRCSSPENPPKIPPACHRSGIIANPQLRDLAVYEPGKPIEETARELGADASKIIKLASNENPLGPSPKALVAMRGVECADLSDGGGFYCAKRSREARFARAIIILGSGRSVPVPRPRFLNPGTTSSFRSTPSSPTS